MNEPIDEKLPTPDGMNQDLIDDGEEDCLKEKTTSQLNNVQLEQNTENLTLKFPSDFTISLQSTRFNVVQLSDIAITLINTLLNPEIPNKIYWGYLG